MLLVALTLAAAGFVVYALESQRLDRTVLQRVRQEISEFDAFQRDAIAGDDAFDTPQALIQAALQRNAPGDNELLMEFTNGRIGQRQPGPLVPADFQGQDVDDVDPAFVSAIATTNPDGQSLRIDSDRYGVVVVAVMPVRTTSGNQGSSFVVAYFTRSERAALADTIRTYSIVAAIALLLTTATAYSIAGRMLRPVRQLREAAQTISDTDLSRRIEVRGHDDLTLLSMTVNDMLDRLEQGFTAQREFLDDAGHELRTPITIVRGHLELMDSRDPADVEQTTALVTDEIDRMSRLVDDLILLAKSRRPDFLRLGEVSVGELTDDVYEKMRALGERTWCVDERADITAVLDEQRVTQALLQLAANAVRFTGRGDTIAVGTRLVAPWLHVWLRDTGTGIAHEHQQRIFERFYQADGSGRGGGLGLSIVHAIATAHGGGVGVHSAPGVGSTFTLVLPFDDGNRRPG